MNKKDEVIMCPRCNKLWPEVYMATDEEWAFACGAMYPLECVMCKRCILERLRRN